MKGKLHDRKGDAVYIHEFTINGDRSDIQFVGVKGADAGSQPTAKPSIAEKAKAIASIARAEGRPRIPPEVIESRTEMCANCPEGYNQPSDLGRCLGMKGCGCYLWAKVRDPKASCPAGHWSPHSPMKADSGH